MAVDVKTVTKEVESALEQLRPFLAQDGGDMELVEVTEDGVVRVKLLGACKDCSMSAMTMKAGLEEAVKKVSPEVVRVEAVNNLEETAQ
tara:strand:- start:238187 stop:238453 length:267 start_codon:yes stop_codon:yes gene_type:complete